MAIYLVTPDAAGTRVDRSDAMIVEADDTATAISMAATRRREDGGMWTGATATAIAAASADFLGWVLRVVVTNPAGVDLFDESYTGVASDTMALMGTGVAAALATHTELTASFLTATVTVATVGDGLGDHTLTVTMTPPSPAEGSVTQLIGTITDGGIAAAALTVVLTLPTAVPNVQNVLQSR